MLDLCSDVLPSETCGQQLPFELVFFSSIAKYIKSYKEQIYIRHIENPLKTKTLREIIDIFRIIFSI